VSCIIEIKNVSFAVQNRNLIKDISCRFEEGKATAVVGPSGCGKTTFIKLAAGILIPSEGHVFFRDKDIARMNRQENLAFRKEGAVVLQDSALWANQSLFQILELPLRLHFPEMTNAERERRVKEVAAEAGYRKDLGIRPAQLSMGEQKMLAFARAMICTPNLLYLDEWTESLDQNAARRLIGIVKNMRQRGASIIMVSHDIRVIRDLADYVIIVTGGQMLLQLTREQITEDEDISRYLQGDME
jgi:ABC-type multidrug transport system ATPase subunit